MDILVTDENSQRLCAIQVKTRRVIGGDKGWHMNPRHGKLVVDDLFYVLVDVGKQPLDPTTGYVWPSKVVADCIRLCHQVWLDTPGRGGRPHKDSNVRRLRPDHSFIKPISKDGRAIVDRYRSGWLAPYRDNWSILGLPETDGF